MRPDFIYACRLDLDVVGLDHLVGRGLGDARGADVAARTRHVLDQHRLAERLARALGDHARDHVGRTAGPEGDDQFERLARKRLRLRHCGEGKTQGESEAARQKEAAHLHPLKKKMPGIYTIPRPHSGTPILSASSRERSLPCASWSSRTRKKSQERCGKGSKPSTTKCARPPTAKKASRSPAGIRSTWCCSTSCCRGATASRFSPRCARAEFRPPCSS